MNTESMEFKRNKRHEPFRYTFVRGISITFEFESFTPTEPSPAAFEIPAACTTSSGSVPQQMLSFLLVAVCMAYFSAYI